MNQVQIFQLSLGVKTDGDIGAKTLEAFRNKYGKTKSETAHFFGQLAHETGGFKVFEENLRYSTKRLLEIFGKYFDEPKAKEYSLNPIKIASRVYANRMGNGAEESRDGWKHRGMGAIQLTGKSNQRKFFKSIGLSQDTEPSLIASHYAFESAIFFFNENKIWLKAKDVTDSSIQKVTRSINGGTHGLRDRKEKTLKYFAIQQ